MIRFPFLASLFALVTILNGCGKSVRTGDLASGLPDGNPPAANPPATKPGACSAEHRETWAFQQPQAPLNHQVDLLFVVDTSRSLAPERSDIASHLPQFVSELPAETDLRMGVLLGHGGASSFSGKLYAPAGLPRVLTTQTQLAIALSSPPADRDEANGEALEFSLLRALQPDRRTEIESQGFFRPEAALSILFITDENDLCFDPLAHGYSLFPDYVPSVGNWEPRAFDRYCRNYAATGPVNESGVLRALEALKGDSPVLLGGITHIDPATVPRNAEDSIGHGIVEMVNQSKNGVLMDIADQDYTAGMKKLGSSVSKHLTLKTRFDLSPHGSILADSLEVTVDGRETPFTFDAPAAAVRLSSEDAGHENSEIRVSACVQ